MDYLVVIRYLFFWRKYILGYLECGLWLREKESVLVERNGCSLICLGRWS